MANVALGIAGIAASVRRVGANADFPAGIELTAAVASAWQAARGVTAAAVGVLRAQVTGDVAATRRLANRHA
jgi:hypothetical protein